MRPALRSPPMHHGKCLGHSISAAAFTDLGSSLHGVSQVTHHHLGLVLLLVSTGQPAEAL